MAVWECGSMGRERETSAAYIFVVDETADRYERTATVPLTETLGCARVPDGHLHLTLFGQHVARRALRNSRSYRTISNISQFGQSVLQSKGTGGV